MPLKKKKYLFGFFVFFWFFYRLYLSFCSAWWCPSPEDCHVHHSLRFSAGAPAHLHPAGHPAQTTLQSPQHPQEPGGRLVLLRAGLPHRNQPDRQPGEELFFQNITVWNLQNTVKWKRARTQKTTHEIIRLAKWVWSFIMLNHKWAFW